MYVLIHPRTGCVIVISDSEF